MSKLPKKDIPTEFKINDEELEQLREKLAQSFKQYKDCSNGFQENMTTGTKIKIRSRNRLMDMDPQTQDQTRQILLSKLQKSSFLQELGVYPEAVMSSLKKKLGRRVVTDEFVQKMTKHFRKQISVMTEKQNTAFKNYSKFYSRYYNHENFKELKHMFDVYNDKLAKTKEAYADTYYRLSHDHTSSGSQKPEISQYSNSKILFSHKAQPPAQKSVRPLDYKLYLNDKIREYKATRKIKKLKEIIQFYPMKVFHKIIASQTHANLFKSQMADTTTEITGELEEKLKNPRSFKYFDDIEVLKTNLVEICKSFNINDDINVDNGAFLVFKVHCYFKERYPIQQKQLVFLNSETGQNQSKRVGFTDERSWEQTNTTMGNHKNRTRFVKKATWIQNFADYEEVSVDKKQHDIVYGEEFDSLLKACLDFAQISDVNESLVKIDFKLDRLKDEYEKNGNPKESIFFEFLKAYTKMIVLKTRENIIKLYDSLNFFRSIERSIDIRKKEIHSSSKVDFEESFKDQNMNQEDSINIGEKDNSSGQILKDFQDNEVVFNEHTIDILNNEQEKIMYDVVQSDFEKNLEEVIKVGAHLIDSARNPQKMKKNSDIMVYDNFNREELLCGLLDYEADYQFEKAKYVYNLFEIFQNTWSVNQNMSLMNYISTTILKRPKFDLFGVSMEASYVNEVSVYKRLTNMISSMISHQKEQENNLKDFDKQAIPEENEADRRSPLERIASQDDSKLTEFEAVEDHIGLERELQKFKAYDFLIPVFHIVIEVEKAIEATTKNIIPNYDFKLALKIQNLILDEVNNAWQQIKYDITLVPAIKEYEFLECDVLLDIPNSYQMFRNNERNSIIDLDTHDKSREETKAHTAAAGGSNMQKQQQAAKGKKKELVTEEDYIMNYIEFIRLKENLLLSLFNSAYQAQIYLDQVNLYGKESIYKELEGKAEKFHKGFLNLLLNIENVQFSFDIKDLGNSKVLIVNHQKIDDLWMVTEYFLLHEIILQNALYINYFHALDVSHDFGNDSFSFLNILRARKAQKLFYNVIEQKNDWLLQTKINPLLLLGKTPKGETSTPMDRNKGKMESISEFVKQVKHFIYFDTLKLQTIEVVRNLRQVIEKTGLHKKGIFQLSHNHEKELEAEAQNSSRAFDDMDNYSLDKGALDRNMFFEQYFDNVGRPNNIFVVPSTKDILLFDLDDISKGPQNEGEDQVDQDKKPQTLLQLSTRVGMALNEELGSPKGNKKRKKKVSLLKVSELEFLNKTSLIQVLETSHYLLQILNFKLMTTTIDSNPLDSLLLSINSFEKNPLFQRNKLRVEQCFDTLIVWLKKLSEQCQKVRSISNIKDNDIPDFLRQTLKQEYLSVMLAAIDSLYHARTIQDMGSLIKIRRFLINLTFNTVNYLYKFANRLRYHKSFNNNQSNAILNEVDLQDSAIMQLIDFAFLDPKLKTSNVLSSQFIKFSRDYAQQQKVVCYGLFDLKKSFKSYFNARLTATKIQAEQSISDRNILPNYQPLQHARELNNILKHNLKFQLLKEAYLFLQANTLPFCDLPAAVVSEFQDNVQYHFSRALNSFTDFLALTRTKSRINIESTQGQSLGEEKVDTTLFQSSVERVVLLKTILTIELEKLMLNEGIEYYISRINDYANSLPSSAIYTRPLIDTQGSERGGDSGKKSPTPQILLPFLYSFTEKLITKALFIDSLNAGECVVLPVVDLESELYGLNATLSEYFDQLKFEMKHKYQGKISILQNELAHLNKEHLKANQKLEIMKKDQQKIVEARVAEINSKLIFDCDMLKKKIKYIYEEHDFNLREVREQIREEFRNKLIDDEISMKRMKARFYEYKEGMSFDIRKFIEVEKGNTLKMIREKKNQIFQTQLRDTGMSQEDPFDFNEFGDSELTEKLYHLLKKTRVLYKFKEAIMKEKHEKEINEMEKQLLANQDLLNKVNDLQNSEKNLKENLIDVKKEFAVVERHNNLLRKNLHDDQKQKIRLYKKNNESKYEYTDLQSKYEDAVRQKAIMVPASRPETAHSFAAYRYHLSSARVLSSFDGRTAESFAQESLKNYQSGETVTSTGNRKLGSSKTSASHIKSGPDSGRYRLNDGVESKLDTEMGTDKARNNSPSITKSFVEVRSPSQPSLYGFNLKTGKKVKKNDNKNFLVKKFKPKQ